MVIEWKSEQESEWERVRENERERKESVNAPETMKIYDAATLYSFNFIYLFMWTLIIFSMHFGFCCNLQSICYACEFKFKDTNT